MCMYVWSMQIETMVDVDEVAATDSVDLRGNYEFGVVGWIGD